MSSLVMFVLVGCLAIRKIPRNFVVSRRHLLWPIICTLPYHIDMLIRTHNGTYAIKPVYIYRIPTYTLMHMHIGQNRQNFMKFGYGILSRTNWLSLKRRVWHWTSECQALNIINWRITLCAKQRRDNCNYARMYVQDFSNTVITNRL